VFNPSSVSVDATFSDLDITISGLEPGVQTTVGPIRVGTSDGFVYDNVVGGATYKTYTVFGDSNGKELIRERIFLNKPPQGDYEAVVTLGTQAPIIKVLIVTASSFSVTTIGFSYTKGQPAFSFEFAFPGMAGAQLALLTGVLPAGISISAPRNQIAKFSGTTSAAAGTYYPVFRADNAAGGFDEIRATVTIFDPAPVIAPNITSFQVSPGATLYYEIFDTTTFFRTAKPNTVYTAAVYQNVFGTNYVCAFLGAFTTNGNGDADLYYQGTDDVYGPETDTVAQLTTYIAEGNYTLAQMRDVAASGVAPYVVAQKAIDHTFAGSRGYVPPSNDAGQ
jgi:hypothetical protein